MRKILIFAKILSSVFRPTYYPVIGFVLILTLTYLSLLPWIFKLWLLAMVYVFTVAIPYIGVLLYRKIHGWSASDLRIQHRRAVPYILHILSYLCCLGICHNMHIPPFLGGMIVVSLMLQCACVLINVWWKVSMHSAGSGAIIGALIAYSFIFNFNPIWWLCGAILLSGLVMNSRLILRQHTLGQVFGGTGIGILCGFLGIIVS